MPNPFIVGDRVRLVNTGAQRPGGRQNGIYIPFLGQVGVVTRAGDDGDPDLIRVQFDDGRRLQCFYWRYEAEANVGGGVAAAPHQVDNAPAVEQRDNAIIAGAPFQIGDLVTVEDEGKGGLYFKVGQEYKIVGVRTEVTGGFRVQVAGKAGELVWPDDHWFPTYRFVLSKPRPLQVGDKVKVINIAGLYGGKNQIKVGEIHEIEKFKAVIGQQENEPRIKLKGRDGFYKQSRFERADAPKKVEEWVPLINPHVGQRVRIAHVDVEHDDLQVGVGEYMKTFAGKEGNITFVHNRGYVQVDADDQHHYWSPGMLEMVAPPPPVYKKGDKVVIAKKAEDDKMKWDEEMDACLFEIGEVIGQMKGYFQVQSESGEFYYLPESLEPKEQYLMADKPLKKKLGREAVDESIAGWVKKAFKEAAGVASYAVVLQSKATGKVKLLSQINDVCHARIDVHGRELERYDVAALIDFPYNGSFARDGEPMKRYKQYVDYMINRSPWAVAFKAKPVDEVINTGIEMDVEKPAGQVAGALIALRHGTEYPEKVKSFVKLLDMGIDEASAWILSFMFNHGKNGFSYGNHTGGHQAIASAMDADVIFKFFKKGFPKLERKKPYREATKYRVFEAVGCDTYYGGAQYGKENNPLYSWIDARAEFTMIGKGFDANKYVTEENMLKLAALVGKELA